MLRSTNGLLGKLSIFLLHLFLQFVFESCINAANWGVRYVYIPLGGAQKKLLNIWVIFTFVAIWHDLEWYGLTSEFFMTTKDILTVVQHSCSSDNAFDFRKLLSWAWLTCLFFIPEMLVKSTANAFQVMLMPYQPHSSSYVIRWKFTLNEEFYFPNRECWKPDLPIRPWKPCSVFFPAIFILPSCQILIRLENCFSHPIVCPAHHK